MRERRQQLGLTPEEAGALAGFSGHYWRSIELMCDWKPPVRIKEIARALRTTERALVGDAQAPPS